MFPAKYRRVLFDKDVDEVMKEVCIEIEKRCQMKFLEIGTDKNHVHFLGMVISLQYLPIEVPADNDPHDPLTLGTR
ncbi:MAG: Transposase IS200 like protein [Syntrophorhabdus sp. PtaU1.Bin002]|nr:MAG: Transposase IS200 like protein [Syntrophorhabdus sp. PtaU1.Bin002]